MLTLQVAVRAAGQDDQRRKPRIVEPRDGLHNRACKRLGELYRPRYKPAVHAQPATALARRCVEPHAVYQR
ncbi:hypothetical protein ACPPVV_16965 [Rhodanobacter sp. Col0626]|uniref:hypothetical protein n=1 Tax=Rhodanobacter sp. Col0626 TaxID=3415679 RepID=UPI003CFB4C52